MNPAQFGQHRRIAQTEADLHHYTRAGTSGEEEAARAGRVADASSTEEAKRKLARARRRTKSLDINPIALSKENEKEERKRQKEERKKEKEERKRQRKLERGSSRPARLQSHGTLHTLTHSFSKDKGNAKLFKAIEANELAKVEHLLQNQKAYLNARDSDGITPLIAAVLWGRLKIMKFLLEQKDISIDAKGPRNRTALHCAAFYGYGVLVDLLLKSGARAEVTDDDGVTPLHEASWGGNLSSVRLLLAAGADPNTRDQEGNTCLHKAAFVGNYDVILLLVRAKAEIDAADGAGGTPLHNAIYRGHYNCVCLLLELGADTEKTDSSGNCPVRFAVIRGDGFILQRLLEEKANPNLKDYGKGLAPIHVAAFRGHVLCLEQLLEAGAVIDSRTSGGMMAIHYAASRGSMPALLMLLGWGASIDSLDAARNTPLHYAVAQERSEIVQFLLYHHANVNHKNLEGKTPLHFALGIKDQAACQNMVSYLMLKGADKDAKDIAGVSPHHVALERGIILPSNRTWSLQGKGRPTSTLFPGGGAGGSGGGGGLAIGARWRPPVSFKHALLGIDLNDPYDLAEKVRKEADTPAWLNVLRHLILLPADQSKANQAWGLVEKFVHRLVLAKSKDFQDHDKVRITYEQFEEALKERSERESSTEWKRIEETIDGLFPNLDLGRPNDDIFWKPPETKEKETAPLPQGGPPADVVPPPPPPPPGMPPPPPPPGGPGAPPPPGGGAAVLNREKLRRFNWVAIPDPKIPETVFKNAKWEPLSVERPENSDIKDSLHKMFYIKSAKKLQKKDKEEKPPEIKIIEDKKSRNLEILMRSANLTGKLIMDVLLSANGKVSLELLQSLSKVLPSSEEIRALREYKGDIQMLQPADRFFYALKDVALLEERFFAITFKAEFDELVKAVKMKMESIQKAVMQVKKSKSLIDFMRWVLAVGNYLNGGYLGGQANGYKISSLLKLSDMRDTDNTGWNLMRLMVQILEKRNPKLLALEYEMPSLGRQYKELLTALTEEVVTLSTGLARVEGFVQDIKSQGLSDTLLGIMAVFVNGSQPTVDEIRKEASDISAQFNELALMFGETPGADVIQIVHDFNKDLQHALEKNRKEIEAAARAIERAKKAAKMLKEKEEREKKRASKERGPEATGVIPKSPRREEEEEEALSSDLQAARKRTRMAPREMICLNSMGMVRRNH